MKRGHCLLTQKNKSSLSKPSAWGNFSLSPTRSKRPTTVCGARSTSVWVHSNLFWQLSKDSNLHDLGMSHATTASPNHPSGHLGGLAMPWSAEKKLHGKLKKNGHPCPSQTRSQGPPVKRAERGSVLNRPSSQPTTQSADGLNRTELKHCSYSDRNVKVFAASKWCQEERTYR